MNRDRKKPVDLGRALVEAFLTNERVNQTLLDLLDPKVWSAFPPCSPRRSIATTFAHVHNVRCMRLKMCGEKPPARLERSTVSMAEARKALVWVTANPGRRKTAGGMLAFLNGWLGRSQNSGNGVRMNGRSQPPMFGK